MSEYKIESNSKNTLFWVSDDFQKYGSYYKTRKGAEKQLVKVMKMAGRN